MHITLHKIEYSIIILIEKNYMKLYKSLGYLPHDVSLHKKNCYIILKYLNNYIYNKKYNISARLRTLLCTFNILYIKLYTLK